MKILSKIVFVVSILVSVIFFVQHGQDRNLFYGDSLGYYSYLPSVFCLHNLDSIDKFPADKKVNESVQRYLQMYPRESVRSPKGHYINQYTCGVALFEMPFFFVAHIYDKVTGGLTNGYSQVYHTWVIISSLFYMLLGFLFSYRILKRVFSKYISVLTISLLLIGSNLLWFGTFQLGMVHNILFFLIALLIDRTIIVHEKPTWKNFSLIAIILGFIALLRPTDVVVVLIPLLYNVYNRETLKNKIQFIKAHYPKILSMVLIGIIPLLPQLILWKIYTGSFIYYSYTDQGFDFLHSRIGSGLFGQDNGWLLYSPLFFLSIAGMFFFKSMKKFWLSILLLTPLYIYIIYSWHCYTYINGFGSRPMIHLYALLAFPLAALLQFFAEKKSVVLSIVLSIIISLFIYVNLHFSKLNIENKYWSESSTLEFYSNMFFKSNLSYNDLVLKDAEISQPDEQALKLVSALEFMDTISDSMLRATYSEQLQDSVIEIGRGVEMPALGMTYSLDSLDFKDSDYLKVSTPVMFPHFLGDPYRSVVLVTQIKDSTNEYGWFGLNTFTKMGLPENRNESNDSIKLFRGTTNLWDTVSIFIPLNKIPQDAWVQIFFWDMAQEQFYTRGILLEHWKKK